MAHKKGLGSSRNGRDSNAQRLGVKTFDDSLYARAQGVVRFDTGRGGRTVSVLAETES
jgi:large subunit ribosomal protein L27